MRLILRTREMARREADFFSKFISRDAFFLKEFMYFTCQEEKNPAAHGNVLFFEDKNNKTVILN